MIRYDFTRQAERTFLKLPKDAQHRIIQKLEYYLAQPNPLSFATRIVGSSQPTYRFRVADWRVIFDWEADAILITKVGHRRDIYSF